uniref:Uncharacterized protein n=1 Tax=Fagus sylvatica TaxID=28930 RepID=A0A2N9F446_FAGSY
MAAEILRMNSGDREEERERVYAHLASQFPLPSPPHSLTLVVAAHLASPRLRRHRLEQSQPGEGRNERERYEEYESLGLDVAFCLMQMRLWYLRCIS